MYATLPTAPTSMTSPSRLILHNRASLGVFDSHIGVLAHPFVLIPPAAFPPLTLPSPTASQRIADTGSSQDSSNVSDPAVKAKATKVGAKATAAEAIDRHLAPDKPLNVQPQAMLMIEGPKFSGFDFSPEAAGLSSTGEPLVINGHRILLPSKKTADSSGVEHQDGPGYQNKGDLTHTAKTASSVWDCVSTSQQFS